jgi:hypothetical protein
MGTLRQGFWRVAACVGVAALAGWAAACATPSPPAPPAASGAPSERVKYGDVGSRDTLQVQATTEDVKDMARIVTDKFLRSSVVRGWSGNGQVPRLVVGRLVNNTDDESIRMGDVYDFIQTQLIQSGAVRIVDTSATDFEYVVRTELTSTHQYSKEGEELYHLTLQTKLFTVDGELAGQWSHEVKKLKEKRRVF